MNRNIFSPFSVLLVVSFYQVLVNLKACIRFCDFFLLVLIKDITAVLSTDITEHRKCLAFLIIAELLQCRLERHTIDMVCNWTSFCWWNIPFVHTLCLFFMNSVFVLLTSRWKYIPIHWTRHYCVCKKGNVISLT